MNCSNELLLIAIINYLDTSLFKSEYIERLEIKK